METSTQAYKRQASYSGYSIDLEKVYYHRIIRDARRFTDSSGEKKLLDIGCFDGTLGSQFLPEWQVYGVEGDRQACLAANEKGVRAVPHDLEKGLPFESGLFDCVIAAEIIEHVYDTDFFLQEIKRVLKNNGVLVMSIPNMACLSNRIKMLLGGYPRYAEYRAGGAGHIRVYTAKIIKSQLEENGFRILRFAGCNLPLPMHKPWIPAWLKKLAVKGGDYFPTIAGQVIISARKETRPR